MRQVPQHRGRDEAGITSNDHARCLQYYTPMHATCSTTHPCTLPAVLHTRACYLQYFTPMHTTCSTTHPCTLPAVLYTRACNLQYYTPVHATCSTTHQCMLPAVLHTMHGTCNTAHPCTVPTVLDTMHGTCSTIHPCTVPLRAPHTHSLTHARWPPALSSGTTLTHPSPPPHPRTPAARLILSVGEHVHQQHCRPAGQL